MDETAKLIQSAHEGDKSARDRLVSENMGLVWSIVRRFGGRGYDPEDLFQIGSIGLIKAIDKFDLSFDVKFSTYAVPMIAGEIKRFLRDDGMIKVSRVLKETAVKAKGVKEALNLKLGREPTLNEIAGELGICVEELAAAMESGAEIESLQKTIYQGDGSSIHLMDKLEEKSNPAEEVMNKMLLGRLLNELSPQERKIIIRRYYMEQTQTQIAKELGISQVQVSRMEKKILKSMREKL
ncbi:MAG: RNA polymerase sporulation sigma factor SigF [Lachnospiraceae bacterium]|nr:RNA polymerase sporulation sigma factor SigF [Lachnospiraceae bacterium]